MNENATDPEIAGTLARHGVQDSRRPRQFNSPGWAGEACYSQGFWHFSVESDEGETKQFKIRSEDYEKAAMLGARYLSKSRVQLRALSKDQELYVIRLAQMGKLEDAVNNYVAYSLPDL